jgi:hypothetical protein
VDNTGEKEAFDRYVYKVVKGWVSVGTKRIDFSVRIPGFQRLIRIKVEITDDENGNLKVVVTDADYHAKVIYYNTAYQ